MRRAGPPRTRARRYSACRCWWYVLATAFFLHLANKLRARHRNNFLRNAGKPGGWGKTKVPDPTIDYPCPYAIDTEAEAIARKLDTSSPGNVVTVEHLRFCRTGNHFSSAYRNLALGYCCKSKLVVLPPKDDVLAPGVFSEGDPGPRWFDFSNAPDVEGFSSSTCTADITWAGPRAFHMRELETPGHPHNVPMLRECIAKVPRLLGCEAAYYFPKGLDLCHMPEEGEGEKNESTGGELDQEEAGAVAESREQNSAVKGAGTLAIHIRSGDIFDNEVLAYYGQPPLQFYANVMRSMPWDRIEIVTYADRPQTLNPVVQELLWVQAKGELGDNVHIHTNRTMGEDLRTMMCADGLTVARSTLMDLVGFHTNAFWVFAASSCRGGLGNLATSRQNTMVHGIPSPREYSVYQNWQNTPQQRAEMVTYKKIAGFMRCRSDI